MEAVVVEKAEILIPNRQHKSFSGSNTFIPKNVIIEGEATLVNGMRRGSPFEYRLFKTDDKKYIFLNKINPIKMKKEMKANASGEMGRPLVVNTSTGLVTIPNLAAIAGAGLGFAYASKKHLSVKDKALFIVIGGVLGYMVGGALQGLKEIKIKEGK